MKPIYWIIATLLGVGLVAAWQYSQQRNGATPAHEAAAVAATPVGTTVPVATATPADVPEPAVDAAPNPPVANQVTQWIRDSQSTDAATRVAAITALADAPRERSLPVLERLVMNADPADRPLALESLQKLALGQGDADNRIRSAIRDVIYHGDDEQLAAGAQQALDAVESAEQRKKKGG